MGMKKPEERAGSPGEGLVLVFHSLDELRVFGPVALREWLKRNRPEGGTYAGKVVIWHQAASCGSEGCGV